MKGMFVAFAMYSKIPMPKTDWTENNMKYAMCWFPLIGAVIGLLEVLAFFLLGKTNFGPYLRGALFAAIPVLITGGIHLDGFMDTMDARSSWGDREKKLEILKDSHTGAFAILGCVVYFLLYSAVWSEVSADGIWLFAASFVVSRCLSGIAVASFACAKNSGLLHAFSSTAQKKTVRIVLIIELVITMVGMIIYRPILAVPELIGGLVVFGYYRWFSYRDFGGITGDLAGYFVEICELVMPAVILVMLQLIR